MASIRQVVLRELASYEWPLSEKELRLVLDASTELRWWQRVVLGRCLHGVLQQLVKDGRVLYVRHVGRWRNDKPMFKYKLATGVPTLLARRRDP